MKLGQVIEQGLLFAALPYFVFILFGVAWKWPFIVLGVIVLIIAAPFIVGGLYGLEIGRQQDAEKARRDALKRQTEAHRALLPLAADDVPPPIGPAQRRKAVAKPATVPAPENRQRPAKTYPHQWRAKVK